MFDFSDINFADKLISILVAILQAILISALTGFVLNRSFRRERNMGKNLNRHGIIEIKSAKGGTMSTSDHDIAFGLNGKAVPYELNLCFLTGYHFFKDFEQKEGYLSSLVQRGCHVKILIANPDNGPFSDLSYEELMTSENIDIRTDYYFRQLAERPDEEDFLTRSFVMLIYTKVADEIADLRTSNNEYDKQLLTEKIKSKIKKVIVDSGDHLQNARYAERLFAHVNDGAPKGKLEMRYFVDEYQMPIIYCKTTEGDKHANYLWTNINAPIRETKESINVSGKIFPDDDNKNNFVKDVEMTFDYLWNKYEK